MAAPGLENPLVRRDDSRSPVGGQPVTVSPRESHSPQKLPEPRWQVMVSLVIVIGGGLLYLAFVVLSFRKGG